MNIDINYIASISPWMNNDDKDVTYRSYCSMGNVNYINNCDNVPIYYKAPAISKAEQKLKLCRATIHFRYNPFAHTSINHREV